jgi:hypothetical protein
MSEERDQMKAALRRDFIPALRAAGFRGSLPHFRRVSPDRTDLLAVQFSKWGGSFVLELAQAPAGEFETPYGKRIPAERLTSFDAALAERCRLGPTTAGDSWFRYDGDAPDRFDEAARAAAGLLPQALAYWAGDRRQPNVRRFVG